VRRHVFAWVTCCAGCGLNVIGVAATDLPPDEKDAAVEASPPPPPDVDGAVPGDDASLDAPVDTKFEASPIDAGPCTTVLGPTLGAADWTAFSDATFGAGQFVLSSGGADSNGAIWMKTTVSYTADLRVTVAFQTSTPGGQPRGDGMSFAWIDSSQTPKMGQLGQSFGFCNAGLVGYGAMMDTKDNAIHVYDGTCSDFDDTSAALDGSHVVVLTIKPNRFDGVFDGATTFGRSLPFNGGGPAAKNGRFGIGGTATTNRSRHVITSVKIESCSS
jgi:hypothetical protein